MTDSPASITQAPLVGPGSVPQVASLLIRAQRHAGNRAVSAFIAETSRVASAPAPLQRQATVETLQPAAGAGGTTDRPTVRSGASGPAVVTLQHKLNATRRRPTLTPSGTFDGLTRAAVVQFQLDAGLEADGVVGPLTWSALDAASGGEAFTAEAQAAVVTQMASSKALHEAGDSAGARAILQNLYAAPILTAKPELRAAVAFALGTVNHALGETAAALSFYSEFLASPFIDATERSSALERVREARLGLPPSQLEVLEARMLQPAAG